MRYNRRTIRALALALATVSVSVISSSNGSSVEPRLVALEGLLREVVGYLKVLAEAI